MLRRLADLVWPTLEPLSPTDASVDHQSDADDMATIKACPWRPETALALEAARSLADGEAERRRNVEGKASTYLLVTAALVPILTYLEGAVWEGKAGTAPTMASVPVLLFAVAYLVAAGLWAFRTLQVGANVAVDAAALASVWSGPDPDVALTRVYMTVARRNRRHVNGKVSCLRMSHMFLLRSFLAFGLLLVVEAGWELWTALARGGLPLAGGR